MEEKRAKTAFSRHPVSLFPHLVILTWVYKTVNPPGGFFISFSMVECTYSKEIRKMDDKQKKAVLNRISRAIGHMEFVKRMVEDDRDPSDVLVQMSAVKSAINSTGIMMIEDQVDEELEHGDTEKVRALLKAMEKYCR